MNRPSRLGKGFALLTYNYKHYKVSLEELENSEAIRLSDGTLLSRREMTVEFFEGTIKIRPTSSWGRLHELNVAEAEQISRDEAFEMQR